MPISAMISIVAMLLSYPCIMDVTDISRNREPFAGLCEVGTEKDTRFLRAIR